MYSSSDSGRQERNLQPIVTFNEALHASPPDIYCHRGFNAPPTRLEYTALTFSHSLAELLPSIYTAATLPETSTQAERAGLYHCAPAALRFARLPPGSFGFAEPSPGCVLVKHDLYIQK